jgi:TATA-binding protein-associated factor Taf7
MEDSEKYMSSPEVAIIPMEDHALIIAMGALEERAVEAMEEEEEKAYHDDEEKAMDEEEVEAMEEEEEKAMEDEEEKAEDDEYKSLAEAVKILSSQVNELLEEKASQVVASAKKESKPISWKQAVIASAKNQKTK